jgi:DNA-binding SARP family transcriptional activator/tetratricopeptide (TPR) repeat protein
MVVEFGVLGAVEAHVGGRPVALGHARQQCVLVALLVDASKPVSAERLARRVWGDQPPQRARNTLHSYVSRLRQALAETGTVGIAWQSGGYVLTADPLSVDLHRFGQLLTRARASDDEQALILFEQAVGLWRGDAFGALDSAWLSSVRDTLHQQRFAAELDYAEVRLRLGQHAALLTELVDRARANPLDERLSGQLMLALHRCGRTGDALAKYQVIRRQLANELGIDPGLELQRLHQQILAGDPLASQPEAAARPAVRPASAKPAVPRQLPAPPPLFTGRAAELSLLSSALPISEEPGPGMVIWAIDGTGGIGKTWLAVRWAHDHVQSFPDGQLYINLRGFGPSGSAVDPAEAVREFLDALGIPAGRIPAGLDAQVRLYRSTLAGKRALIVLDNARDVEQVRPLLPGSPGCMVVVTSRGQLAGLVAADGACPLSLDLLTVGEARDVLASRLGGGRVSAEPAAVAEIIVRCAGLPLALAIAAARAAAYPGFPLARLADELRDTAGGLDAFAVGDAATDVRTVFSWSYQALSAEAARLFRLLGLPPRPDISAPAAASLTGVSRQQCRQLLAELTGAHLLAEHAPGRYVLHDLLRAYAAEKAHAHDDEEHRRAAVHRVLDHYLQTARPAALLLHPRRESLDLAAPLPGVVPEGFASHDSALAWFTAERPVLLASIELAARAGLDTHVWQLALSLSSFLLRRGLWPEQVAVQRAALAAARRLGSTAGQAHALRDLALGYARWGRLDDAETQFRHALGAYTELGDPVGQANAHTGLAELAEFRDRPADALSHAQQALDLHRGTENRVGLASALNGVGWSHALLGDYQQTLDYCTQALTLLRELDDVYGVPATWDSLGYAHRGLADYAQAASCYQHALDAYRDLGDSYCQADVLTSLGDTHCAAGDPNAARKAWEQALCIIDQLPYADTSQVRDRLGRL